MINLTTLKGHLYDWVDVQTAFDIVWANQNAPRPDDPYVTLFLPSFQQIGRDGIGGTIFDDPDYIAIPHGDREFILSIQSFGAGAMQEILNIANAFQSESARQPLMVDGIAYVETLDLQDVSQLISSELEERGMVDIRMRIGIPYGVATKEDTGAILKIKDGVGTINDDINIDLDVDAS